MVILKIAFLLFTLLLSSTAMAREVEFVCISPMRCEDFLKFKSKFENVSTLESAEKIVSDNYYDGKYINISIKATDDKKVSIVFEGFKRIKSYRLNSPISIEFGEVVKKLGFKSGVEYSRDVVNSYVLELRNFLATLNMYEVDVQAIPVIDGESIVLEFKIINLSKMKLKRIVLNSKPWVVAQYSPYFFSYYDKEFDPLAIKLKLEQITKELYQMGFFKNKISIDKELRSSANDEIEAHVKIELSDKYNISLNGIKRFTPQELRSKIYDRVRVDLGDFNESSIREIIVESYEKLGYYGTDVKFRKIFGEDKNKNRLVNVYVEITEGYKVWVSQVIYKGMNSISPTDVNSLFEKSATPLAKERYYDKEYYDIFSDQLKKLYYSKGFVQVEVSKPIASFTKDKKVSLEYYVNERESYTISSVQIKNVAKDLESDLKIYLTNKENKPIDISSLESDLQLIVSKLQERGYYFANVKNTKSNTLLQYDRANLKVLFSPEVELGNRICFNDLIIAGNRQTKSRVFEREFHLKKGDLITPSDLERLNQRLSNLGLFATLKTTPYIIYDSSDTESCSKTNVLIQVREKDFGVAEIAPGYRTDLGWKLSAGTTIGNIGGMNRQATLQAQSNLRTSLSGFDLKRKQEDKELVEYTLKFGFIEPYLFHNMFKTQIEFETQASTQKKRFYGFDANIHRLSPQLSKSFTNYFVASVRYQFEKIEQFNATELKDNDDFVIGSITPSLTFDLRDDPVYTRKGAYFNLTSEWANKYFGSMENEDLQINYIKLISRNRFYIPMGDVTLAMSTSLGYQKNFATEQLYTNTGDVELNANGKPKTRGYIPSIKLFRLEGYDEVRGFEDSEINVVESGENIGEIILQDSLYFVNFKLESRYNINDQLQFSIFYDAGRLFSESVKPFKLRSAVGAGIKILTPVGSLDFDYGVKIDRRKNSGGAQESFGRFHLSIGFF